MLFFSYLDGCFFYLFLFYYYSLLFLFFFILQESDQLQSALTPVAEEDENADDRAEFWRQNERFEFWRQNSFTVEAAQMLRSLSKWSGNPLTEQSIYKAYQVTFFFI
jgi:hypothetical protein